ncbi:hypothetical protein F5Y00DRAFT_257243 [Daldinia vernicosa]|uniref:uncharacterized protein n=1 Tax=Daldinia vernicosa TaxID=114800 RepID=UPI002008350E|nr:uncharacterized protein F5Y00DRAFT_257243 [Daldinia vernicosa]KAI0853944.1 hypothetical protein F5Y00DRAFT_257243 [Daldinia vernicosa]
MSSHNNTNGNTSNGERPATPPETVQPETVQPETVQPFPYYDSKQGHNNYPPYPIRPPQSLNPTNLHTYPVWASRPGIPLKGPTASHFGQGQQVTAPPPSAPVAPEAYMGPPLSIYGNFNTASQTPYGAHTSPSRHPETMPNGTMSPTTPRVVLPPPRRHQHHPNSQTPTHRRTGSGSKGKGTAFPPSFVPSSRQIITDPRQTVVSSPTFNNYYLPMQARGHQNLYQGQQIQMPQPHIGSTAHAVTPQEPKPPLDRHARQRILDEQAKSFSEEDDAAFYPHKD